MKSLGLTRESQKKMYRQAKELAVEDMEKEDPTEGEVVEYISKAYIGAI